MLKVSVVLWAVCVVSAAVGSETNEPQSCREPVVSQNFYYSSSRPQHLGSDGNLRDCPYPFKSYGSECYFLSSVKWTWDNARQYCLGLKGDLATPENPYVLFSIILEHTELGNHNEAFWIGLYSDSGPQNFQYLHGETPTNHDLWHPGLPGQRPNDNCVYLHKGNARPFANFPCTNVYRFVCQYR